MSRSSHIIMLCAASTLVAIAGTAAHAQCNDPKWVRMNVSGPQARTGHAMTWDSVSQRIIMFGGVGSSGQRLNDTWAWDGTSWTQVATGGATPSARSNHAMATWAGLPIIFGGTSNGSDRLGDTLVLFNNQWTPLSTIGLPPLARAFHSMTTLGTGNSSEVILMGGTGATCNSPIIDGYRLTAGGTWLPFTPPSNLGRRTLFGLVNIQGVGNNDFAILQGNITPCSTASAGNVIWHNGVTDAYNVVQGNPPQPARWNFAAASNWNDPDAPRKSYVMFGGDRGGGFPLLADTWHMRETTPGAYNTFSLTGTGPTARRTINGMAWDMTRDNYLMFGGNDAQVTPLGDTWLLTYKPVFVQPTENQHICLGTNATFTAVADGPGPITYSWSVNGVPVNAANFPTAQFFFIGGTALTFLNTPPQFSGTWTVTATNSCGSTSHSFQVVASQCNLPCGPIDFNGNSVFPEDADVIDFFNVLAGAPCPTGNCYSIDFNGNNVFPEDADIIAFFRVLAGGSCN